MTMESLTLLMNLYQELQALDKSLRQGLLTIYNPAVFISHY